MNLSKSTVEHTEAVRIYGIHPGVFTGDVTTLDEIDFWMLIDSVGGYLWWHRHHASDGRIPYVDLTEHQCAQEYLVYHLCKKIGIEVPEPTAGMHVLPSTEYMEWFTFYNNHFRHVLSDEKWDKFLKIKDSGDDISKYLPKGSWKKN